MPQKNRGGRRAHAKEKRPALVVMRNPDGSPGPEDNTLEGRAIMDRQRGLSVQVDRIPPRELELAYRRSGIIFKGINRKARDSLKKGFRVIPDDEDADDERDLNRDITAWMRATGYIPRAIQALREMYVFGDGFLELGFDPDDDSSDEPPLPGARPVAVYNVDPYAIRPVKEHRPGRVDSGTVVWYLTGYVTDPASGLPTGLSVRDIPLSVIRAWLTGTGNLPSGVFVVHPDRIQHFQVHTLRDDPDALGIPVVEAAYMATLNKMMGDKASGEILEWYAQGFFTLNIDYATEEEQKKGLEVLALARKERRNYFCGSERAHFDIKSPSVANVKPFYDNFHIELSAALEIPAMLLIGVGQRGSASTGEAATVEYYDDVRAFQELLFNAPMYDLLKRILGRDDFSLEWIPLYVDKQTEANLRFKDMQSAVAALGAQLLTRRQAIYYLRDGSLPFPDDVPDDYVSVPTPTQPKGDSGNSDEPNAEPEPNPQAPDGEDPPVASDTDGLLEEL